MADEYTQDNQEDTQEQQDGVMLGGNFGTDESVFMFENGGSEIEQIIMRYAQALRQDILGPDSHEPLPMHKLGPVLDPPLTIEEYKVKYPDWYSIFEDANIKDWEEMHLKLINNGMHPEDIFTAIIAFLMLRNQADTLIFDYLHPNLRMNTILSGNLDAASINMLTQARIADAEKKTSAVTDFLAQLVLQMGLPFWDPPKLIEGDAIIIEPRFISVLTALTNRVIQLADIHGVKEGKTDFECIADIFDKEIWEVRKGASEGKEQTPSSTPLPAEVLNTLPDKHILGNSLVQKALLDPTVYGAGALELPTMPRRGINTSLVASVIDEDKMVLNGPAWTVYDQSIFDAACTLYEFGNKEHIFTARMIAQQQGSGNRNPKPQKIAAITKSLERQRHIDITIDPREELTARGKEPMIFKNYMLPLTETYTKVRGKWTTVYRFMEAPPLLSYNKAIGHLTTVRREILEIRDVTNAGPNADIMKLPAVSATDTRLIIRDYLLRRIAAIKNDQSRALAKQRKEYERARKDQRTENASASQQGRAASTIAAKVVEPKQKPVILFDTMFEELGITGADAKTDSKKYATMCCDYWTRLGHIKRFSVRYKGTGKRSPEALEIVVNDAFSPSKTPGGDC